MLFIVGNHPKTEQYRAHEAEYCFHCHNTSRWIISKNREFLSFFFLPVVPLKTDYFYSCSICGNTKPLDKAGFEEKIKGADPYHPNH